MPYRKFSADFLFTGFEMLDRGHVLVTDEEGYVTGIVPVADAGIDVQHFNGILSPGFINCHCHLELSHMKGMIPQRTGLVDFLIQVMQQRGVSVEQAHTSMQQAERQIQETGTVAVGDICNTTQTIALKEESALQYYNFIEVTGFSESGTTDRFSFSKNIYEQFRAVAGGGNRSQTSLVPHAPYSVSHTMFQLINSAASGKTISIHNQECRAEEELYRSATGDFYRLYQTIGLDSSSFCCSGKSSLQTFFPLITGAKNILLVHNTFTPPEDVDYSLRLAAEASTKLFWCLCAKANLYIEGVMPPVDMLATRGCHLVLGTDSLASNDSLDLLAEMQTIRQYYPGITTAELLQFATINGARALQMDRKLGSFEKGKQPGIVLIEGVSEGQLTPRSRSRIIST